MDSTEAPTQSHVKTGAPPDKGMLRARGTQKTRIVGKVPTSEPQSPRTQAMPPIVWTSAPLPRDVLLGEDTNFQNRGDSSRGFLTFTCPQL